jgi:dynein heavy chain
MRSGAEQDTEAKDRHKTAKAGGLTSMHDLFQEAYADSECRTPILLLMRNKSDAVELVTRFHLKNNPKGAKFERLVRCPLGQGLEADAEHQLLRAAASGDWIVLENLHLVDHWLPELCNLILKLKHGAELNPRFRLWIACNHTTKFPVEMVQKSIKIALEPSKTIKSQMKAMLSAAEKESFFRKSGKMANVNANLHKNLYFALMYFHSVVLGRGKYGPIGWNAPYDFDGSDFEVSNAQLLQLMRLSSPADPASLSAALNMLSYFYANVNYAGKI